MEEEEELSEWRNSLKEGSLVDVLYLDKQTDMFDVSSWVEGQIVKREQDNLVILTKMPLEVSTIEISIHTPHIAPYSTKTIDSGRY